MHTHIHTHTHTEGRVLSSGVVFCLEWTYSGTPQSHRLHTRVWWIPPTTNTNTGWTRPDDTEGVGGTEHRKVQGLVHRHVVSSTDMSCRGCEHSVTLTRAETRLNDQGHISNFFGGIDWFDYWFDNLSSHLIISFTKRWLTNQTSQTE